MRTTANHNTNDSRWKTVLILIGIMAALMAISVADIIAKHSH